MSLRNTLILTNTYINKNLKYYINKYLEPALLLCARDCRLFFRLFFFHALDELVEQHSDDHIQEDDGGNQHENDEENADGEGRGTSSTPLLCYGAVSTLNPKP